jgi:hypothetical protein
LLYGRSNLALEALDQAALKAVVVTEDISKVQVAINSGVLAFNRPDPV